MYIFKVTWNQYEMKNNVHIILPRVQRFRSKMINREYVCFYVLPVLISIECEN